LIDTKLASQISGRIFEYAWHSKTVPVLQGLKWQEGDQC
jgi:hypothetical protein